MGPEKRAPVFLNDCGLDIFSDLKAEPTKDVKKFSPPGFQAITLILLYHTPGFDDFRVSVSADIVLVLAQRILTETWVINGFPQIPEIFAKGAYRR